MTKREYFNAFRTLFELDGYKLLMEEIERDKGSFEDNLKSGEGNDLYRAQGALYYIDRLLSIESALQHAYDDAAEEGELDAPLPV